MSARAVPCEVPAIKRNIVSGCKEPTESCARANREGISQKSRCGKRGPCEERLRSHLLEARFWAVSELLTIQPQCESKYKATVAQSLASYAPTRDITGSLQPRDLRAR